MLVPSYFERDLEHNRCVSPDDLCWYKCNELVAHLGNGLSACSEILTGNSGNHGHVSVSSRETGEQRTMQVQIPH